MGTLILSAILVSVVLGFDRPAWWFAAAALLHLYVRYVRPAQGSPGSSPSGGAAGGAGGSGSAVRDSSYHAYRRRRDQMARWDRRYRRERPWNTRG